MQVALGSHLDLCSLGLHGIILDRVELLWDHLLGHLRWGRLQHPTVASTRVQKDLFHNLSLVQYDPANCRQKVLGQVA